MGIVNSRPSHGINEEVRKPTKVDRGQGDRVWRSCSLQIRTQVQNQAVYLSDVQSPRTSLAQNLDDIRSFEEPYGRGELTLRERSS